MPASGRKGKSCDNFGQLGPWLVTRDEVADPQALPMWLRVNGEAMQEGLDRDHGPTVWPISSAISAGS